MNASPGAKSSRSPVVRGVYQRVIYKSRPIHFCASSIVSEILTYQISLLSNSRSRSKSTIFTMTPFDFILSKFTNITFFYFRKGMTCANDTHTHTQSHTETNKAMAIGEITDVSKNAFYDFYRGW